MRVRLVSFLQCCRFACIAVAGLAACRPVEQADAGLSDGSIIYIDRTRDDAGNLGNALVHAVGVTGSGLTLTLNGAQQLEIPSSGLFHVPIATPSSLVNLLVSSQPKAPAQQCEVAKLDEATFSVLCQNSLWDVSGVINGLEGKGMRIALYDEGDDDDAEPGGAHNVIVPGQGGPFSFTRPLEDSVTYSVVILQQPTSPGQVCTVSHGDGTAFADISDIQIDCVTNKYTFFINTIGLKGSGLILDSEVGPFEIKPGEVDTSPADYPDGYVYFTHVLTQPKNPSQVCYVENGNGVINGAPVEMSVICDSQGTLRISEVGACPFSSSACWIELVNLGATAENLSFYKLRTSALSTTAFAPSRVFTLPAFSVPPLGRVMVQAQVAGALPDGKGLVHVEDNGIVPWWSADGFVELLNPSGATADFIRWGSSTVEPSTGGVYGGGSAPALPKGASAYGYSLQHFNGQDDGLPKGTSYKLWSFPTPGGPNDVTSNTDLDNDGIPDTAEVPGGTYAGVSFYDLGARIGRKDIFVEIDHMGSTDPATLPRKEALDKVVEVFKQKSIFVHFDVGNLFSPTFSPADHNLGGGNEVPFATAIGLAPSDPTITNLYDIKAANMVVERRMIFYYQLFAWSQQKDGSGGSSGVGEMPGNDSIITLGGFGLQVNNAAQRNLVINYQAASVMHELGHNFSLRHGGSDSINRKPNYVSVMNYLYSPLGLPTIGNMEGDRFEFYKRCSVGSVSQLTNSPSGDPLKFVIDYSSGSGSSLDENAIREGAGLGRAGSLAVDFNCNTRTDTAPYSRDLNADGALDVLLDNNDWSALDFVFRRYAAGADNGPSLRPELERFDVLSMDAQHNEDEPCPAPAIPSDIE